jgi:hypothetical protein
MYEVIKTANSLAPIIANVLSIAISIHGFRVNVPTMMLEFPIHDAGISNSLLAFGSSC